MNYRLLVVSAFSIVIGMLGPAGCQGGENVLPLPPDAATDSGGEAGAAKDGSGDEAATVDGGEEAASDDASDGGSSPDGQPAAEAAADGPSGDN